MLTRDALLPKIQQAYAFAETQLRRLIESHPDQFPLYTTRGRWDFTSPSWTNWCEGFLGGQLWLIFLHNPDPWWRAQAEHYSGLLEPRQHDRAVHDLGFLFWPTYRRWYELTSDLALKGVLLQAGETLAQRYQEKGRYLHSFLGKESLFIDIMMNVGLIFYTAQQTGNKALGKIAARHCLTTRRTLVRGDGSTAHEGLFNPETGQFLRQSTQQGYRADSCWARGQAWALYGFSTAYGYTHDKRFLHTAQSCADFYLEHTPAHGIPPNDWDEPHPSYPYESSAAAIAASGFWELAKLATDPLQANRYREASLLILETLTTPEFLACEDPSWEGLLKHAIYHQGKGLGVDESVMWGDYFFLEALHKVWDDDS